jgi:hypothetical protein
MTHLDVVPSETVTPEPNVTGPAVTADLPFGIE